MPIIAGQPVPSEVLKGLASQDIPISLIVSPSPPLRGARSREVAINHNRDILQGMVTTKDPLVLLLDSDVVLDDPSTISKAIYYLHTNSLDCVCLDTKGLQNPNHVIAACAVIRTSKYLSLDFQSSPGTCQCMLISMVCRSAYHPTLSAHELPK